MSGTSRQPFADRLANPNPNPKMKETNNTDKPKKRAWRWGGFFGAKNPVYPPMVDPSEVWKPVPDMEGVEVSSKGRIRYWGRIKPQTLGGRDRDKGKGYFATRIRRRLEKTHRLVALAFVANPRSLPLVDHLNGNTRDNRPENLEWVDARENNRRARALGLVPSRVGEQIETAKVDSRIVQIIRTSAAEGHPKRRLASAFGISPTQVERIIKREAWRHVA